MPPARRSLGVIYPSVRRAGGTNLACFRPALVGNPRRAASFRLTWAGSRQPQVERLDGQETAGDALIEFAPRAE